MLKGYDYVGPRLDLCSTWRISALLPLISFLIFTYWTFDYSPFRHTYVNSAYFPILTLLSLTGVVEYLLSVLPLISHFALIAKSSHC